VWDDHRESATASRSAAGEEEQWQQRRKEEEKNRHQHEATKGFVGNNRLHHCSSIATSRSGDSNGWRGTSPLPSSSSPPPLLTPTKIEGPLATTTWRAGVTIY